MLSFVGLLVASYLVVEELRVAVRADRLDQHSAAAQPAGIGVRRCAAHLLVPHRTTPSSTQQLTETNVYKVEPLAGGSTDYQSKLNFSISRISEVSTAVIPSMAPRTSVVKLNTCAWSAKNASMIRSKRPVE